MKFFVENSMQKVALIDSQGHLLLIDKLDGIAGYHLGQGQDMDVF